jgi:hypothetical protein
MKVQFEPRYTCDICGKESIWIKGQWIAHVFPLRYDEYEFHLCSEECDEKLLDMSKVDRVLLFKSKRK